MNVQTYFPRKTILETFLTKEGETYSCLTFTKKTFTPELEECLDHFVSDYFTDPKQEKHSLILNFENVTTITSRVSLSSLVHVDTFHIIERKTCFLIAPHNSEIVRQIHNNHFSLEMRIVNSLDQFHNSNL